MEGYVSIGRKLKGGGYHQSCTCQQLKLNIALQENFKVHCMLSAHFLLCTQYVENTAGHESVQQRFKTWLSAPPVIMDAYAL